MLTALRSDAKHPPRNDASSCTLPGLRRISSHRRFRTRHGRRLFAVAVDAESGERRAFDRSSSVPLTDGVAASCAAPGISPPITIEGRPTGSSSLPKPRKPPSSVVALDVAVEALPAKGAQVSP